MEREEVGDRTVMHAIYRVADRASDNKPNTCRRQPRLKLSKPVRQPDRRCHREADKHPPARIAILLQSPYEMPWFQTSTRSKNGVTAIFGL